jgi:serine/threonine protein kinase
MNNIEENTNSFFLKLSDMGYDFVRHIGQGGYSDVSLVFSKKYNQYFALKQNTSNSKSELLNERELLIQLDHPNIINLYSMIEVNTIDCLVFEYCSE